MNPVEVIAGDGPIVLGVPHAGTFVPPEIEERLNGEGRRLRDTDWHVDRLYSDLVPGATMVRATFHRYVIDANRDPTGLSLYPGQNTTGLVPVTDFDGRPIWREGEEPSPAEIEERLRAFHAPYHAALAAELERARARHGVAILHDCHSIRSRAPFLFDGLLSDINIGTNDSASCAPVVEDAVTFISNRAQDYTCVLNGRFKGGWTTRHYGAPRHGVHAVQTELAQSTYLASEALPFAYDDGKAEKLRDLLSEIFHALNKLALSGVLAAPSKG